MATIAPSPCEGLVREHMGLAKGIAAKMISPAHPDFPDRVSEAYVGLCKAARDFDPDEGTAFSSYAFMRIRGAVLDAQRKLGRDRRLQAQHQRIELALWRFAAVTGRYPNPEELADLVGMNPDELAGVRERAARGVALRLDQIDEGGDTPHEWLGDPGAMADMLSVENEALRELLDQLPDRERMVLGLLYWQDYRLHEIAPLLGVTESRVCQIHARALERLRPMLVDFRDAE